MWLLIALLLLSLIWYGSAFDRSPFFFAARHRSTSSITTHDDDDDDSNKKGPLTHKDIFWIIRPPPTVSRLQRLKWKILANLLRWDCLVRFQKPPTVLCPNNFPSIVLEAHLDNGNNEWWRRLLLQKKIIIGRFGITCVRGPSAPLVGETVQNLYSIDASMGPSLGLAAIIYMFVEPEFRGRHVGKLSLEVISLIHAKINADFTILVADDKSKSSRGSGSKDDDRRKLVKWYEQNGYSQAPLLQEMMGSPNERFGVSMIAPTNGNSIPEGCRIQWW